MSVAKIMKEFSVKSIAEVGNIFIIQICSHIHTQLVKIFSFQTGYGLRSEKFELVIFDNILTYDRPGTKRALYVQRDSFLSRARPFTAGRFICDTCHAYCDKKSQCRKRSDE